MDNSREYWNNRAASQGPSYVGPAGREDLAELQEEAFRGYLEEALGFGYWDVLLDFGCGSGRFAELLAQYCGGYFGADISVFGIAQAREANPALAYEWLDRDSIPLGDDSVDIAIVVTVFQHIVSDEDFELWTSELRRVLRPDAPVFVIDARYEEREVMSHMRLRGPAVLAASMGRVAEEIDETADHWIGWLR